MITFQTISNIFNAEIELWKFILTGFTLPLSHFFYKIYKDKKDRQDKLFDQSLLQCKEDLKNQDKLLDAIHILDTTIKTNQYEKIDIKQYEKDIVNYFKNLNLLCQGIKCKRIYLSDELLNDVTDVIKNDLIQRSYNMIQKAYKGKSNINIIIPDLHKRFKNIYWVYKKTSNLLINTNSLHCR